jgi:hypothetical protein
MTKALEAAKETAHANDLFATEREARLHCDVYPKGVVVPVALVEHQPKEPKL